MEYGRPGGVLRKVGCVGLMVVGEDDRREGIESLTDGLQD